MRSGPRLVAVLSAFAFLLLSLLPATTEAAHADPRAPETIGAPELPGGGTSPMLLAAIGGYLLTGGLALLLLKR
ncbi:hypothetical protein AB0F81_19105 [Actinoplanes sp. NPDC024001]|uniref:hypothetical protein n=1 Tax=Actinoplanes sp. NPDC024001 TaxID=3154598 RepID=UPI0033CE0166